MPHSQPNVYNESKIYTQNRVDPKINLKENKIIKNVSFRQRIVTSFWEFPANIPKPGSENYFLHHLHSSLPENFNIIKPIGPLYYS